MAIPRVVVALGLPSTDLFDRIAAGPARGLRPTLHKPGLAVWSSGRLETWRQGPRRGWIWWPLRYDGRPATWEEASDHREALGVEVTPETVTVHGSSLGMQPFYYRRFGDVLVFASRISDLCAVSGGALTPNWSAWASIFTVRGTLGAQTPFTDVRRMRGGEAWRWDRHERKLNLTRRLPSVCDSQDRAVEPADVVDMVDQAIRRAVQSVTPGSRRSRGWLPWRGPGEWAITLSGGGDSRLLAAYAARILGPERLTAYTTSPDDGADLDLELSVPVAEHLGLRQEIVEPDPEDWPGYTQQTFERVEYQTPYHMWIEPLAAGLRADGLPVLDGLAGDVLLKSGLITERAIAAPPARRADAMWAIVRGAPKPGRLWVTDKVNAELRRLCRPAFHAEHRRFAGHPAELELSLLFTRTSRSIALSPFALFCPESTVAAPYLDREVMRAALSVPAEAKAGGRFFRGCLELVDRRLAELASTGTSAAEPHTHAPRRSAGPPATTWAMKSLTALAHRQGLDAPQEEELMGLAKSSGRVWLHGLLMFSEWLERYESRLTEIKAPWW